MSPQQHNITCACYQTETTTPCGNDDKDRLANLDKAGFVDIEDISLKIIDAVCEEQFCHHTYKNFRHNFKDFSAAFDLEANR